MEVMVIQRELCAVVMLKVKAFFSDMHCHRNKWLNTGHLKRSKSCSMGMLKLSLREIQISVLINIQVHTPIYNMLINDVSDIRRA